MRFSFWASYLTVKDPDVAMMNFLGAGKVNPWTRNTLMSATPS